jgi:formylglycine-generating enzyme required for sulfatase activity
MKVPWVLVPLLLVASCGGHDPTIPYRVPANQITPDALDFGNVEVFDTKALSFTIRNRGVGILSGTPVMEHCAVYRIESGRGNYALASNEEQTVTVRFTPTASGSQACTILLISKSFAEVHCTGTGTLPAGMMLVPAGSFTMGSPADEPGRSGNETQHGVDLTKGMLVSGHEVTQSEWQAVMGWNESSFQGPNRPVEQVTWYDAVSYCNQRSTRDGYSPAYRIAVLGTDGNHITSATVMWNRDANGYRLLTEAEWEYACRAMSPSAFGNGDLTRPGCAPVDRKLDLVGWYCGNASGTTQDAGGKAANAWGLQDMHGNVREWCWDWYADYQTERVSIDPFGPSSGLARVLRGGSWADSAGSSRSAARSNGYPQHRDNCTGLRLAKTGR